MPDLLPFAQWLRATPAADWINSSTWVWPLCESLHFMGLSVLVGITGFFDLRLMGFFRRVSVEAARALMPFALVGLVSLVSWFAVLYCGRMLAFIGDAF